MDNDFEYVRALVHRRAAIVLEAGKEYLLSPRLSGVANAAGMASVGDLVARLRREPHGTLHDKVIEAMTTNETTFFRDHHPFDLLRTSLLPRLIAAHGEDRRLRLWSAACSTGQEPYSMAMTLLAYFPQLASWDVRIIATDLSSEALGRAKEGRYSQLEIGRGLPATLLATWFERRGTAWVVKPQVRSLIEFRQLNLVEPLPFVRMFDLVMLRNVLIYFDTASRDQIIARVRAVMRDPGFLVLGSQESAREHSGFLSVTEGRTTYYVGVR